MKSMSSATNIRKVKIGKRGGYIVEASLTLPAFIVAMILLISVIPFIGACENAVFAACDEIRAEAVRACAVRSPLVCPAAVTYRMNTENMILKAGYVRDFDYMYAEDGIEDLIYIKAGLSSFAKNPAGGLSFLSGEFAVRGRAFTGADGGDADKEAFTRNENGRRVFIFPKRGEKYHNRGCPFLNPACEMNYLNGALRRRFKACPNCRSGDMSDGEAVFCFYREGRSYHRSSCSTVEKYYVSIDEQDAIAKGYTACGTCGG